MTTSETRYRYETTDDYTVVSLLPPLNDIPWGEIESSGTEILQKLSDAPRPALMVDLSALDYMGSAMVALLIRLWKASGAENGQMVVVNREQMVKEVLVLAGLSKIWKIVGSRDAAVQEMDLPEPPERVRVRSRRIIGILASLMAFIGIGFGMVFLINPSELLTDQIALAIIFGFSSFAFLLGIVCVVRSDGVWRILSLIPLLVGLESGIAAGLHKAEILDLPAEVIKRL